MKFKEITKAERAAVIYHLITGDKNREDLYLIAQGPEQFYKLKEDSRRVMASNWFRSVPIQEEIKKVSDFLEEQKQKEIAEAVRLASLDTAAGKTNEDQKNKKGVNFLNPDEFLQFANLQANKIQDDKERRAYLELIAKLMNYKENDSQESEVIRAYLPLSCENCELYKRCKGCSLETCSQGAGTTL